MPVITESKLIKDLLIVELRAFADERGQFIETFRKEWFPQRSWDRIQTNRSDSKAGVLRGLHYHFKQVDYWYVPRGVIKAAAVDMRPGSPTFGQKELIEMGDDNQIGLFIPVGIAHGFVAVTDATLTYLVDNYYDSQDEFGVIWNDPQIGLDWGVTDPILSGRDLQNKKWSEIPKEQLPHSIS